jgi:Cof subfamily protein (haloacid dehalogenase superfamily)
MGKRLFITDLDGTLMTDAKTISSQDLSTLERLQRNGVVTVVATGRSVHSLEKALKAIGFGKGQFPIDYVLFSTGSGIMVLPDREIIFQRSLTGSDVRQIMDYFDLHRLDYMVHRAIPHTREFLYRSHNLPNPDFETRLAFHPGDGSPLEGPIRNAEPATQVLAVIPAGADAPQLDTIRRNLPNLSVIQATSPLDHQSVWIEVFHKDVSKSKAADFLAERLSIHRRDSIAIGNDYNDEDLLAWSGKGYVVENAPERLRRVYETVGSNNACGITMAAERSGWIRN